MATFIITLIVIYIDDTFSIASRSTDHTFLIYQESIFNIFFL